MPPPFVPPLEGEWDTSRFDDTGGEAPPSPLGRQVPAAAPVPPLQLPPRPSRFASAEAPSGGQALAFPPPCPASEPAQDTPLLPPPPPPALVNERRGEITICQSRGPLTIPTRGSVDGSLDGAVDLSHARAAVSLDGSVDGSVDASHGRSMDASLHASHGLSMDASLHASYGLSMDASLHASHGLGCSAAGFTDGSMDACDEPWGGGAAPGGAVGMPEERLSVGPSALGFPMVFPIPGDGEGQPDTGCLSKTFHFIRARFVPAIFACKGTSAVCISEGFSAKEGVFAVLSRIAIVA